MLLKKIALIFMLLFAVPSWAATYVQSSAVTNAPSGSGTVSTPGNVTAGNFLVVAREIMGTRTRHSYGAWGGGMAGFGVLGKLLSGGEPGPADFAPMLRAVGMSVSDVPEENAREAFAQLALSGRRPGVSFTRITGTFKGKRVHGLLIVSE